MKLWKPVSTAAALFAVMAMSGAAEAQKPKASPAAKVSQGIGAKNEITITYHRPGVKGRNVWKDQSDNAQIGPLVPRDGNPRPWRAGANNTTAFETKEDIMVEGQKLPAGKYGLYMIPTDGEWTVIFNKDVGWGSFRYKAENDVLRVDVRAEEAAHEEWLIYGFEDLGDFQATAYLRWDKVKVSFKITMEE
jgi:hypothetical protein